MPSHGRMLALVLRLVFFVTTVAACGRVGFGPLADADTDGATTVDSGLSSGRSDDRQRIYDRAISTAELDQLVAIQL